MSPNARPATWLLHLYRAVVRTAAPLAYRKVADKLRAQGVTEDRIGETRGHATLPRPDGDIIWFHAASVGESLSVLTLITRLSDRHPRLQFLMTSGTATSADLIARRMPPNTRHQFAPLDIPAAIAAFYDHWMPRAGIFVESELWPNILLDGRARGMRLALLNARMSEKSVRGWQKWPKTAATVMNCFDTLIAQNPQNAENLARMGAPRDRVRTGTNLKAMSAPLPVDADALAALRTALGDRPVWVASSTHAGEEDTVLAAHRTILAAHPDACLVLIPRHPERGTEVAKLIAEAGLTSARRSAGDPPDANTQVYLADTLGETGTFYTLCPIVFVAGSLLPIGGHNPFEPAQTGAAVLTGPHRANFAETYEALLGTGAATEVADASDLARVLLNLFGNPAQLDRQRTAARQFANRQGSALDQIINQLETALDLTDA